MLRLFGPVLVETADGPPPRFRSQQTIALLGYLVVEGRPVAREHLASLFWADAPVARQAGHLRRALHNLGTILPGCLQADRRTAAYRGGEAPCAADIQRFRALLDQGEPPALRAALDLYRGELLEGVTLPEASEFERWLLVQRELWRQRAAGALERLLADAIAAGATGNALDYARRLLALEPWREDIHRRLMLLFARSDRRAAALAHYRLCCRLLATELDVEPEAETIALAERIRSASPSAHNLPPTPTPFVGRRAELAALRRLLAEPGCRLVTLLGLGGAGKSRLAQALARTFVSAAPYPFLHGVRYLRLAPPGSGDLAAGERQAAALAGALGLTFRGSRPAAAQLLTFLAPRELLLVLDGDEELPDSRLLRQILRGAPDVRLLVTAREPLRLQEERRFPLEGLSLPDGHSVADLEGSDSGRLLLAATRRLQPGFDAGADPAALVAICRLTGGLPLALELAAGWLQALPPATVAGRLQADLALPPTTLANLPARHRSLHTLLDATWEGLAPEERAALAALTVAPGSFTAQTAGAIAGAPPALLALLAQKSLLQPAGPDRFRLHPLLRQYAAARLQEPARAAARARHAAATAALLPPTPFYGPLSPRLLPLVQAEEENVNTAWEWALAGPDPELLARLAPVLAQRYRLLGPFQAGQQRFAAAVDRLLPLAGSGSARLDRLSGWLLVAWTRFLYEERRLGEMLAAATRAGTLAGTGSANRDLLAAAHLCRGQAHYHLREDGAAQRHLEHALALAGRVAQPAIAARALRQLGALALRQERPDAALAYLEQARARFRESGDIRGEAGAANNLGLVAVQRNACDRAAAAFAHAATLYRRAGDRWGEGLALINEGNMAARLGDYAAARATYRRALPFKEETGDRQGEAIALVNLSLACHHLGRQHAALRQAGRALRLGRDLAYPDLIAYALSCRGFALDALANERGARAAFEEAIALWQAAGQPGPGLDPLAGLARLHLRAGRPDAALALVEQLLAQGAHIPGAEEPGRIWLTCYEVLQARGDARAAPLLADAAERLRQQAAAMADPAAQQAYLHRVPYHEELLEAGTG